MPMPAIRPVTTIEELWALPDDGQRHELLDGVHVMTPSPALRHQRIVLALIEALRPALRNRRDLELLTSPADIRLGPRTMVQPDLFICRVDPSNPAQDWPGLGTPVVAIEILSPGTAARDRGVKRRIYQRAGVAEYWVVDPDARLIERWTPAELRPEILDDLLEWRLEGQLVASIQVASIFGDPSSD